MLSGGVIGAECGGGWWCMIYVVPVCIFVVDFVVWPDMPECGKGRILHGVIMTNCDRVGIPQLRNVAANALLHWVRLGPNGSCI